MNIRKAISATAIAAISSLSFTGCAPANQPDPELQKAVLILAKKVERLERLHGIKAPQPTPKRDVHSKAQRASKGAARKTSTAGKKMVRTTIREIPVYEKQSKNSKKIDSIPAGTVLTLTSCDRYGWCLVDGKEGYIQSWKLKR